MTDLVVLSLEAWDAVWRRNQHLVSGLLEQDERLRVLFVEPAADPLHALRSGRRARAGAGLRGATDRERLWLYQPTKVLPRAADPGGDRRRARAVVRAARRLRMHEPVLWINDPAGARVLARTGWRSLYDVTDDWLAAVRTPAETRRLREDEATLLLTCEEVVVCSAHLAAGKGTARPVTLVPNAVDLAPYRAPVDRPADLPPGPVAVYVGTIHTDRIDVDLCLDVARVLGRGRLVLVGPAPLPPGDRERLVRSGVVLLGAKDRREVPGYLRHADVLLVPHVVTPFTESLDPIKLYEYRAAGRPVVSTPVAGFRGSDDPQVTVADRAAFPEVVRAALTAAPHPPAPAPGRAAPAGGPAAPAAAGAGEPASVRAWSTRVTEMRAVLDRLAAR
ncbi:glycosyltransferase [Georgenia daeguensis]|uniref:Glycosyltransferase n=1 Tax=Georgenia daeguensis TaxID=908355 RepID=A0ABP8ETW6_9MICO